MKIIIYVSWYVALTVWALFCMPFIGSADAAAVSANTREPACFPSLISAIRIKAPLDFCGEQVPLDDQSVLMISGSWWKMPIRI